MTGDSKVVSMAVQMVAVTACILADSSASSMAEKMADMKVE